MHLIEETSDEEEIKRRLNILSRGKNSVEMNSILDQILVEFDERRSKPFFKIQTFEKWERCGCVQVFQKLLHFNIHIEDDNQNKSVEEDICEKATLSLMCLMRSDSEFLSFFQTFHQTIFLFLFADLKRGVGKKVMLTIVDRLANNNYRNSVNWAFIRATWYRTLFFQVSCV